MPDWISSALTFLGNLLGFAKQRDAEANAPAVVASVKQAAESRERDRDVDAVARATAGDKDALEELRRRSSQ